MGNSVNVFLGLGISWTMGAIYWYMKGPTAEWKEIYPAYRDKYTDGGFIVEAGDLSFSVVVFLSCSCVCMFLLFGRRKVCGGELGGPKVPKAVSAMCLMVIWFVYVAVSWLYMPERISC